jgi:hypothetical protein
MRWICHRRRIRTGYREASVKINSDRAGRALAIVRLFNGSAALLAPELMLRRLGTDPRHDPSGIYPLRMFGIRTVLIGVQLLASRGEARRHAARIGILIHASDTIAAATGGLRGQLPRRAALVTTLISSVNTALAVVASRA